MYSWFLPKVRLYFLTFEFFWEWWKILSPCDSIRGVNSTWDTLHQIKLITEQHIILLLIVGYWIAGQINWKKLVKVENRQENLQNIIKIVVSKQEILFIIFLLEQKKIEVVRQRASLVPSMKEQVSARSFE